MYCFSISFILIYKKCNLSLHFSRLLSTLQIIYAVINSLSLSLSLGPAVTLRWFPDTTGYYITTRRVQAGFTALSDWSIIVQYQTRDPVMWVRPPRRQINLVCLLIKDHSNLYIPCVFPVFALSDHKYSLWQFMWFVTIRPYILKTEFADLSSLKIFREIFAAGNLQLEKTKFGVFWQNFQIPCVLTKFPNSLCFP